MLKIPNSTKKQQPTWCREKSRKKKCVATRWHLEERNPEDSSWLVVEKSIWKVWVKLEIFHKFWGENSKTTWNHHLVKKAAMSEERSGQLQAAPKVSILKLQDFNEVLRLSVGTKEDLLLLSMEEIQLTSWYVIYPIIYMVLHIPGG